MTPKEKAKELMQKAYDLDKFNKTPQSQCKVIALLCVKEILDLGYVANEPSSFRIYDYFSKVKIELNKLQLIVVNAKAMCSASTTLIKKQE